MDKEEMAEAEFKKASQLEAQGALEKAAIACQNIIKKFGDTTIAKDAESCLKVLEEKAI